jgi:hypothetical protein
MNQACWPAAPDGRSWIDVALGTMPVRLMLDTGLVDPLHQVGFEVVPPLFDHLEQSGQLLAAGQRQRRDANNQVVVMRVGLLRAQLIDPIGRHRIGPAVPLSVFRGTPNVPNRIGVEFFHRLRGCRATWDLDARL